MPEAALPCTADRHGVIPYDASLYNDVGDVYRTDGHCEQSIPLYQKALLLNPDAATPDPAWPRAICGWGIMVRRVSNSAGWSTHVSPSLNP
jgi:hypothetical protein